MYRSAHILIDSPSLYQRIFRNFFDRSDGAIPKSFSFNQHLDFQLIDPMPEDEINFEQNQGLLGYMDDRYDSLIPYRNSEIKTIWYNPESQIVSGDSPIHDVDLEDLNGLKAALPLLV